MCWAILLNFRTAGAGECPPPPPDTASQRLLQSLNLVLMDDEGEPQRSEESPPVDRVPGIWAHNSDVQHRGFAMCHTVISS